ncbi:MAG: hypothetical protein ACOYXO_00595, partial [Chloroflexota bacterium]
KLYGTFSYDKMSAGGQWSVVWVRLADNKILCFLTEPWTGSTGGYGYSECEPPASEWLPGEYQVRIFVGLQWKSFGQFTVVGEPPTPTPTATPTRTPSPSATASGTPTPTFTRTVTLTLTPTHTRTITLTQTPTHTRTITLTPTASRTPTITSTPTLTRTLRPTDTRWPTSTP